MKKSFRNLSKNYFIVLIFIGALVLRLVISPPFYSGDVNNHIAWGGSIVESGTVSFYQRNFANIAFPTYGPLGMLPLAFSFWLFNFSVNTTWFLNNAIGLFPSNLVYVFNFQNTNMLATFMKFSAIFGDLLAGFFIFKIATEIFAAKKPWIFPVFYLFNPAVFYLSANWGQFESLVLAFALGAIYFLFRQKTTNSAVFFIFSQLTKQTSLIFAPVFYLALFKKAGLKKLISLLALQIGIFWIFYLPFFSKNPLQPFTFYLSTFSYVSDRATENAFNLWYFIFAPSNPFDFEIFLGLPIRFWSLAIFLIFAIFGLALIAKKANFKNVLLVTAYLILTAFLFLTRMHERYLAYLVPILLLLSFYNRGFLIAYLVASIGHFLNLYNGFFQPNLPFLAKLLENLTFVRFLIVINLSVFLYLLLKIIQDLRLVFLKPYEKFQV